MSNFILDRKGREILPGDTLKVFHFSSRVGRGRRLLKRPRRYYSYKYVLSVFRNPAWPEGSDALRLSHLSPEGETYIVMRQGQQEPIYEIVQGYGPDGDPFDRRIRRRPAVAPAPVEFENAELGEEG